MTALTKQGYERTIRGLMTTAANYVERAKNEPERAGHWMLKAYAANDQANMWLREYREVFPLARATSP